MKKKAYHRTGSGGIRIFSWLILVLLIIYPLCLSASETIISLREKESGNSFVSVEVGDTVAIEVVVSVDTVKSQGVSFYISFNDSFFSVINHASEGDSLIRPFDFTGGMFGDGWKENDTHDDPGNGIERFQLDGSEIKGTGTGYKTGEGVEAVFYLVAAAAAESSLVSIDYDRGNRRDTRLHILQGGESDRFKIENEMYISVDMVSGVEEHIQNNLPMDFSLAQNYPNPFNPETVISYSLSGVSQVELKIFNITGQVIRTLINSSLPAGFHSVRWDGRDDRGIPAASGIYIYSLKARSQQLSRKMLLLR